MKTTLKHILSVLLFSSLVTLLPAEVAGQDLTITGTVISEMDEEPLPGVNVQVKGTNIGTSTDVNGEYEIQISDGLEGEVLVFSFIGYADHEEEIDGRETIDVALEADIGWMDEVVVTGYGERTERDLSASISTVSGEELEESVASRDVAEMLQGQVPGLQVTRSGGGTGTSAEIELRGRGSIGASSSPLFVVDGVIGTPRHVNPNDVESISVLKDADATAQYGARAANGVVLINTKSGQRGETRLNVNTGLGVSNKNTGNFSVLNAQELYGLQEQFRPEIQQEWAETDTDWQDHAFQTGLFQDYDVSISSGTERTRYYVSGGYHREQGHLDGDNFERITGRVNVSHDVMDNLEITTNFSARVEESDNNTFGAAYQAYTNLPWDDPYNEEGELRTGLESDWIGRDNNNFLYPRQYNYNESAWQSYTGNVRLDWTILPWLEFRTTNSATFHYSESESFSDARTPAGADDDGSMFRSEGLSRNLTSTNIIEGESTFDQIHTIGGLLGFEFESSRSTGVSASGIGAAPGLSVLNIMSEPDGVGGGVSESAFIGGFVQAYYDYDDRYSLNTSFRRDGSSVFGADNRFGNFYSIGASWMLSSESFLTDVEAIDILKLRASYGTTGNAAIGNYQAQGIYSYTQSYDGRPGGVPDRLGAQHLTWEVARTTNLGIDIALWNRVELDIDLYNRDNTDLLQSVPVEATTGFTSQMDNIGTVNNRGVEIALTTHNITGDFNWSTSVNFSRNRNEVTELFEGEAMNVGNQRIEEGEDLRTWYMRKWAGVDPETGDPLWEREILDAEGNVEDVELTSNRGEATRQKVGTATPDFTAGVRNTFHYRGFSLTGQINIVQGKDVYHSGRTLFDSDGGYINYNYMDIEEHGWSRWEEPWSEREEGRSPENAPDVDPDHTHPRPMVGGNSNAQETSSRFLEDGSYIRLQTARLSYDLPPAFIERIGAAGITLSVQGDNIWTSTDFSGMDPETGLGGTIGTQNPVPQRVLFNIALSL